MADAFCVVILSEVEGSIESPYYYKFYCASQTVIAQGERGMRDETRSLDERRQYQQKTVAETCYFLLMLLGC